MGADCGSKNWPSGAYLAESLQEGGKTPLSLGAASFFARNAENFLEIAYNTTAAARPRRRRSGGFFGPQTKLKFSASQGLRIATCCWKLKTSLGSTKLVNSGDFSKLFGFSCSRFIGISLLVWIYHSRK